jgi:hypothetical protein
MSQALANSSRSAPVSVSRARNLKSRLFLFSGVVSIRAHPNSETPDEEASAQENKSPPWYAM